MTRRTEAEYQLLIQDQSFHLLHTLRDYVAEFPESGVRPTAYGIGRPADAIHIEIKYPA